MRQAGAAMGPMLSATYGIEVLPQVHTAIGILRNLALTRWSLLGATDDEAERHTEQAVQSYLDHSGLCESPIEHIALVAMVLAVTSRGDMPAVFDPSSRKEWPRNSIVIAPQFKIGRYRLDFLVRCMREGRVKAIAVECDGKDYHTGQTNQDADIIRDGYLANIGIETRRFTGSHLYRKCEELQVWLSNFAEWEHL